MFLKALGIIFFAPTLWNIKILEDDFQKEFKALKIGAFRPF